MASTKWQTVGGVSTLRTDAFSVWHRSHGVHGCTGRLPRVRGGVEVEDRFVVVRAVWEPIDGWQPALIITLRNASEGWLGSSREERAASPQIVAFWGLAALDPSHPPQC